MGLIEGSDYVSPYWKNLKIMIMLSYDTVGIIISTHLERNDRPE